MDTINLSTFGENPGRIVRQATDHHRPVWLTDGDERVAIVQSAADFERAEDERAFMRAVVQGLADVQDGREVSLAEARERLGLK